LIAAIYAAAAGVTPGSEPLEMLTSMTRSDKAFVGHFNVDERRGSMLATFNIEPNFIDTYSSIFARENPWLARSSYFQAEGLVWQGSDIVEHERLIATNFYKLFMHGQTMERTAHLVVRVRGPDVIHITLTRGPHSEEFDDEAIEICQLYAKHARRALDISATAATQRFMEQGFQCAFAELSAGVALVEMPGTIRYVNEYFQTLFTGRSEIATTRRTVPLSAKGRVPPTFRLPRPLAEALAQPQVPKSCVIVHEADDGRRPIFVEFRPFVFADAAEAGVHNGYAIVCRSPDAAIEIDEASLRSAFNLTASEARVCAALVVGENIEGLAARLDISPMTVRTHVKHIFEKTYTTRQSELMKLLVSVARRRISASVTSPSAPASLPVWPRPRPRGLQS
jgi:DNA-binding CsgD family transcriptional regulator